MMVSLRKFLRVCAASAIPSACGVQSFAIPPGTASSGGARRSIAFIANRGSSKRRRLISTTSNKNFRLVWKTTTSTGATVDNFQNDNGDTGDSKVKGRTVDTSHMSATSNQTSTSAASSSTSRPTQTVDFDDMKVNGASTPATTIRDTHTAAQIPGQASPPSPSEEPLSFREQDDAFFNSTAITDALKQQKYNSTIQEIRSEEEEELAIELEEELFKDRLPRVSSGDGTGSGVPGTSYDLSEVLAIDPAVVEMVTLNLAQNMTQLRSFQDSRLDPNLMQHIPFVSMFRGSANYIANHRNTLAVYHIPGELLDLPDPQDFRDLMNDIALTWLLGMKIVLVVGCRHQIQKRIKDREHHFGIAVTNPEILRVVKEEAGYVRFEVERQLARSLRLQGNSDNHTMPATNTPSSASAHYDGNVVSGNFFSAQPFGILDGVDYQFTGFVRKVEVNKIRQLHQSRDICLLTTLGVSPSGEVFNVNSESLAATVAGALGASKIIYFTEKDMALKHKVHGNKIQHLRLRDAKNLLKYHNVSIHKRGFVTVDNQTQNELDRSAINMLLKIGWSMQALEQGVKRAHIISPKFGAVLQELYTRDGSGTLISGDLYEGIRRAEVNDVTGIHELINPLIKLGKLIDRPKAQLEKDINHYYVYTRDNCIVACGQLQFFEDGYAEIGCLVVNSQYRARGRGDAMLGYLERLCYSHGASMVFVLSTQTMEWFQERGFEEVSVDKLPKTKRDKYNHERASKIYMKQINSARDLDASELWWNR